MSLERGNHHAAGDARVAIGEEERTRIGDALQALLDHLEQAEFGGGTEAMLRRAQKPKRVVTITLELQHGVDHVFEHARTGEATFFRDVSDQHDRQIAPLGFGHQCVRTTANLHHAAR